MAALEAGGRAFGLAQAVAPLATVAKILGHIGQAAAAALGLQDAVHIDVVADESAGDHDRLVLQGQQRFQLLLGLVGAASGYQLDHIKGVSIQRDSAQLGHHLGGDGTIAGEGRQLVDFIFQQKLVLAAAVQQGGFRALSKLSAAFVCPTAGHLLQGGAAGFIELHAVAQLLTGCDHLLLPLAGAQLAELFLDDAGHDEDGVFGVGQRIA